MSIQKPNQRTDGFWPCLKRGLNRDRSRAIPNYSNLHKGNTDGLEAALRSRPELLHAMHYVVMPAVADAQTEQQRHDTARSEYTANLQEKGRLVGEISDFDEQTALMLAGGGMWVKLIILSTLSALGGLYLTFRRDTPSRFRETADHSTWMVLFTAVPLWLSTCRLVGIKLNHGITPESLAPIIFVGGFAIVVNLALKEFVSLCVQITRQGFVDENGSVHIDRGRGRSDYYILIVSMVVIIVEMFVGAPGIIGALPLSIAKNPVWQSAALLLSAMGAMANQALAWTSGLKAKRQELRWRHFTNWQDALWSERTAMISRAFEIQKLIPALRREQRRSKQRSRAAYRKALRVYRHWWWQVSEYLLEQRNQPSLPTTESSNGDRHGIQRDRELR